MKTLLLSIFVFACSGQLVSQLTAPILNLPNDGSCIEIGSALIIDWTDVTGANGYQVNITDNLGFNNTLNRTTSNINATSSTLQNGTTYYWKVRSVNSSDTSQWSTLFSFIAQNSCGGNSNGVILTLPLNNSTATSPIVNLDWDDVTNATTYKVEVSTSSNMSSPQVYNNINSSQKTLSNLTLGTTYYWKVRSYYNGILSGISAIWSFTTPNSTSIKTDIKEEDISLFPNPTVDFVFANNFSGLKNYKVYDVSLKVHASGSIDENNNRINLTDLNKGIYFIEISSKGKSFTKRVIKK